jgi:hypothetical protein
MNTKVAFDPAADGEITSEHLTSGELAEWSGSDKLRESCVALRSSLSHLLVGNANTAKANDELSAALRQGRSKTPVGGFAVDSVVGAQVGNLLEYVEMYCLASLRGVFRVRAINGQQGTLWFEAGQLVHANVDGEVGEDAALKILAWGTGTLTPSSAPFPVHPSIETPWQSLVLRAEAWI